MVLGMPTVIRLKVRPKPSGTRRAHFMRHLFYAALRREKVNLIAHPGEGYCQRM